MTDTLFNQPDPAIDENIDFLAELTKPGAKFDRTKYESDEDMYKAIAKGKYAADHFIETKNRQYDALYDEYGKLHKELTTGSDLKSLLEELKNVKNKDESTHVDDQGKPALTADELRSTVSSLLSEMKISEREESNYNSVQQKLKERFGASAAQYLREKAESLNLSEADVNALARKNPALFYKTFDVTVSGTGENFQTPPHSQQRSEGFSPKTPKRTLSYYRKLQRENPKEFLKPSISLQMDKDAQALGADFFDV